MLLQKYDWEGLTFAYIHQSCQRLQSKQRVKGPHNKPPKSQTFAIADALVLLLLQLQGKQYSAM